MSDILNEYETAAREGLSAIREFLSYRGKDRDYHLRAKIGGVVAGSYARLRATLANERALALAEKRIPELPSAD